MTARKILVTSALPYANGPIHLGHLVEYIQTDIWVRAMKAQGCDVKYVCADDAHGTAIMLKAQANGVTPEEQIANIKASHEQDFAGFLVDFDNYHSTHSPENEHYAKTIYQKLDGGGFIFTQDVEQLFDTEKGLFLADRFVKGDCPKCHAKDQYGDNCEVCSATYNATELNNPYSTLSQSTPIIKSSEHYFFDLPKFDNFLDTWTKADKRLQSAIANKLAEWFDAGLKPWDISRDAPYFGFQIPNTTDKYFYVWLDAPVGYMASFKNLCDRQGLDFDEYFNKNSTTELYHFIGKDIVYFHALFWPAMLQGANYRTPTAIFAHGFLTVNGEKMSKSRGTFIQAKTYLDYLNPEYLRYYFASKLSDNIEDINLDLADFMQKVNSDLVGKVVNIASRCAKFINSQFNNTLSANCVATDLINEFIKAGDSVIRHYENREFSATIREIMALADIANQYIDDKKPWSLAKQNPQDTQIQEICSVGLNLFLQLAILLSPVLPNFAQEVQSLFNLASFDFQTRNTILTNHQISTFKPLMSRVEKQAIDKMVEASKDNLEPNAQTLDNTNPKNTQKTNAQDVTSNHIGIDTFAKVQMKVAKVLACDKVMGADKLLQFTLDVGEDKTRNVFSGIAKFYSPEQLVHKTVICVTNLAPRKMKFGVSEGMILSAEKDGQLSVVLLPDDMPVGAVLA